MCEPISVDKLQNLILDCELDIKGTVISSFWESIKVLPRKWQNHPMGDEGGGFWVVAIFGQHVIWYNDIEEGFNISTYSASGFLDEYWCSQSDLKPLLTSLRDRLMVVPATII